MAIVRFFVLALLCLVTFAIGSGTNQLAKVCAVLFVPFALALYFLPTIEANLKKQKNITSIFMVNFLLGWSLVGWVVAAAWAHKSQVVQVESVQANAGVQTGEKECPFCAEIVKAAAKKCKHCGSDLA